MGLFFANGKTPALVRRAARRATLASAAAAALAILVAAPAAQAHSRCASDSTVCYGVNWQTIRPEQLAQLLQEKNFNARATNYNSHSPLHYAAQHNPYPDTLRVLINAGADMENNAPGHRPIHEAAWANPNPAIVDFLARSGASVQATSNRGLNLLHFAAQNNTPAVIAHIALSLNFSPLVASKDGRAAAHHAAQNPRLAALVTLQALGADLSAATRRGATPLHYAAQANSNIAVLDYLRQNHTPVTLTDNTGASPLHYAAARNTNTAVIHYLIEHGAQLTVASQNGKTMLHYAASNTPTVMRAIISRLPPDPERRAINQPDRLGYTPLHYAARSRRGAISIPFLTDAGAGVNRFAANGRTPIRHALLDFDPWNLANAKALIARGARLSLPDYFLLGIHALFLKLDRLASG